MELTLEVLNHDGTTQIVCHGNVVAGAEAESLRAAIDHILASNVERVALNLQHVRKMDCAGLGVLADAARRARQMRKAIELKSVPQRIQRILKVTRLDLALAVYGPSLESQVTAA